MNFKNSILVFGLFALLITACESKEEKFAREFGKEMEKATRDIEREMEKFEREMKQKGY